MANKNSIYVGALTSFILDTKPYHSKLTEIQEIYQFADSMTVHFDERLFSTVLTKAAWTYSFFSDGVSEVTIGGNVGKPMPLHQLTSPLVRGYFKNDDQAESRGAFKAYRDENTDLPLVPLAFDPKCLQGTGLSDAFIQRNGQKAFNEPILEGHDVFLSKGAYVAAIKQTVSTQPKVIGRFTDVYEVTDGPFPILVTLPFSNADALIITGPAIQVTLSSINVIGPGVVVVNGTSSAPNYDAEITERSNENLMATVTSNIQAEALDVADPVSAVNQIKAIMNSIGLMLAGNPNADASLALSALMVTLNTPALPTSYEALLNALIIGGTPIIAGYVGWVGQDVTVPYTDKYVDDALAALSPSMYFNSFTDVGVRESGALEYRDLYQGVLAVTNIVSDPIRPVYEEWTLTAISASTLTIRGSVSGPLGIVITGSSFNSVQLAFNTSATGAMTVGDVFLLTPAAKLTVHYQAPLEVWSLIRTNPRAYSRPALNSTRYGFIRSQALVPNYVTVVDTGLLSTTIVLTATSSTTFHLSSTAEPSYTGTVTVNTPFNDGRLAFTIVAGTAYSFSAGDKFFVEILNELPTAEDLDLFYGYDLDPYDADTMVYNTVSSLLANYLEELGFGYDSRFVGYDLTSFGLVIAPNAGNNIQWRLRALPDLTQPLALGGSPSSPTNQVNVLATDDPLNPFAVSLYDMVNDVTSEGVQSSNDPDSVADLRLWYSTSFNLEYFDQSSGTWVSAGVVPVGVLYSNPTYGLSFTIIPGPKPFISAELSSSWYPSTVGSFSTESTIGGDTIAWTIRNPDPVQTEPAGLSSRNAARLIMYGDSFHGAPPVAWVLKWTSTTTYEISGIYNAGILNGTPVGAPIVVNTSTEGYSYRNNDLHLHFTVVPGVAGLQPNDTFSFSTYDRQPTFLVHGSVSGWQPDAVIDEWYWNGKIGFKIPSAKIHVFDAVSLLKVGNEGPWATSIGTVSLNRLRPDTPTATYVAHSHANGHWTLYKDGKVVADGDTVLSDDFLEVTMPVGVLGNRLIFSIEGQDRALSMGHDLAIIRTSAGRSPTANDFILLERTESDTIQISIKGKDPAHQTALNALYPQVTDLRFVDHNANSGVPLSNTSPETGVITGWLPVLETRFDKTLSVAEFSDFATHVEVRAAATGEVVGTVESLSSNPAEPVVFRWAPAFHTKYLPLNSEATVVTLGSGMDERVNVNMREGIMFLVSGGGLADSMLFADLMRVNVSENLQWAIHSAYDESAGIVIADAPFGGFLPGYDNMRLDFETGIGDLNNETPDGYYDAGVPLTDYFQQAQSLALLPSMTPQQQALYNDLHALVEPYLDGDIITTTLAEFLANIEASNAINWTPILDFGVPSIGMGMQIETSSTATASASFVEGMTILAVDAGYGLNTDGYGIGNMDEMAETTAILLSQLPPSPVGGLPPALTLYADFMTPLMIVSPGSRLIEVAFTTAPAGTPAFYLWRPTDSAPSVVPIVERLSDRRFRFSLPAASELKLIVV